MSYAFSMTNTAATRTAVFARDMIAAQGFKLTADMWYDLAARAAAFRKIITDNGGVAPAVVPMHVDVVDIYTGQIIGRLTYQF